MIVARGTKTYTVNLEIESDEGIRDSFLSFDREDVKEVFEYIEKNVRPLVPFKRIKNFGWRKIYEGTTTGTLYIEVIFNLEDEKLLRIL